MNTLTHIKAPERIKALVSALPPAPYEGARLCEVGYDSGLILWTALRAYPQWRGIGVEIQPESEHRVAIPTDLQGRVTLKTGDGFHPLASGEIQSAILAGMGGPTIARILSERADVSVQLDSVVCCASHLEGDIRPALKALGLKLVSERLVLDRGRYYEIIVASAFYGHDWADFSPLEAAWGPLLLRHKDPLMAAFLRDQKQRFRAAFAADLDNYREGSKAALGAKLALWSEAYAYVTGSNASQGS